MKYELERNSPNLFSLHFSSPHPSLVKFMKKELGNNILINKNTVTFPSSNAYFIWISNKNKNRNGNYQEALWMMHSLSKQILFLKEERNKVLLFDCGGGSFENVLLCIEDQGIFFSLYQEEDLKIWKEEVGFGDAFYNLGYMILQFLHREKTDITFMMKSIWKTKLYWFLLRAMDPNPANRTLLFI